MRKDAHPPAGGIYRPRNPRTSPLYQCVRQYGAELDAAGLINRQVESEVLERFLACGDLHHGFARIYCDLCGHDYLLAYSCKTRYFCPSCHQKRMLAYGAWLEENLLAPVPPRHSPRLHFLRGESNEQTNEISRRGLGAGGSQANKYRSKIPSFSCHHKEARRSRPTLTYT